MVHVFISIFLGLLTATAVAIHQIGQAAPFYRDFFDFWRLTVIALNHPELTYDPASITGVGPFAYPPTALLVFTPFALMPFPIAYSVWVLGWLTFYLSVATYLFDRLKLLGIALLVLASPVWTVALLGQTTLALGALILTALLVMPQRKLLAGVMFGIAAIIKPQTVVMMPLALLATRDWRVIASAATVAFISGIIATIIFGFDIWFDWLGAFPGFFAAQAKMNQVQISLWPLASKSYLLFSILALLASFIVWTTFRATNRVDHRLVSLIGSAWLISPYVPDYELAMIAPAVVAYILKEIGSVQPILMRWRSYIGTVAVFAPILGMIFAPVFLILNTLVVLRQSSSKLANNSVT
jgi:Glycosyltransferase family 87